MFPWRAARCTLPLEERFLTKSTSFSGGSGAGGSMIAAASQSAKASTGWWARPVAAAVACLVAARMADSSALADARDALSETSWANPWSCSRGASLTYCLNISDPQRPNNWILQSSIWVRAMCTAPVALAEWLSGPVGPTNFSFSFWAIASKVPAQPDLVV